MTTVTTVAGPISSADIGVCLNHEHILNDVRSWWHRTSSVGLDPDEFARKRVGIEDVWDLKHDPFGNLDNCRLDDLELAVEEVGRFAALGGRTIVETTGMSIGRNLAGLREVSERTGVQIVAGTGYYLEASQPPVALSSSVEQLAESIVADIREGEGGVRPGIIGEIGVSDRFSPAERKSLSAACLAQRETGLPMQVHLPGWFRLGDEVLDIVTSHGVDLGAVVCPGGRYRQSIGGVTVRAPDGVHFPYFTLQHPDAPDPDTLAEAKGFGQWLGRTLWPLLLGSPRSSFAGATSRRGTRGG